MTILKGRIPNAITPRSPVSNFHIFITDRRLIIARAGISWAIAGGFGAAGMAASLASGAAKAPKDLSPQQILESHKKNREIPLSDIEKVKVKKALTCCHLRFFYTNGKKEYFEFPKPAYESAKSLLVSALGNRVEAKP